MSKALQKEIDFFVEKVQLEQNAVIDNYRIALKRMKFKGMSKEGIRKWLNQPQSLLEWDKMVNRLRKLTAEVINQVSQIGYMDGMR